MRVLIKALFKTGLLEMLLIRLVYVKKTELTDTHQSDQVIVSYIEVISN